MKKESYTCPVFEIISLEKKDILTESTSCTYEGQIVGEEAG